MSPQLVGILAAIFAAQARIAGMQARNAEDAARGKAPFHSEDLFYAEAAHLDRLSHDARNAQ